MRKKNVEPGGALDDHRTIKAGLDAGCSGVSGRCYLC